MKNTLILLMAIGLFASCQNAPKGEKAATTAAKTVAKTVSAAKTLKVSAGSTVAWNGKKLAGEHSGVISVSDGMINVANGKVTGGKFTIDMGSITCTDLEAGKGKEDLEGHLKSPDFFDVAKFPTSTFEITGVVGNQVTGNLTMIGATKSITFPADIKIGAAGAMISSPSFTINRTDWGLKYGSATFFDGLKDKAINDNIGLTINLKAS